MFLKCEGYKGRRVVKTFKMSSCPYLTYNGIEYQQNKNKQVNIPTK